MYAHTDEDEFEGLEALADAGERLDRPAAVAATAERINRSTPAEQASKALAAVVQSYGGQRVEASPALAEKPRKERKPRSEWKVPAPTRKPSDPSTLALNIGIVASDKMKFLRAIARDSGLKDSTVRVAVALIDLVNNELGHSFISYEALGVEACCGWQTAQRSMMALESAGYIVVDRIEGGRHHVATRPEKLAQPAAASARPAPRHDRKARVMSNGTPVGMSSQTPPRDVQPDIQFRDSDSETGYREKAAAAPSDGNRPSELKVDVRSRSIGKPSRVPIPSDYKFPADAVAEAKADGITGDGLARSKAKFLTYAKGRDTLAGWDDRGAKWLARERPSAGDEIVTTFDGMGVPTQKRRGDMKSWEVYRDAEGVRHPARSGRALGPTGSRYAI